MTVSHKGYTIQSYFLRGNQLRRRRHRVPATRTRTPLAHSVPSLEQGGEVRGVCLVGGCRGCVSVGQGCGGVEVEGLGEGCCYAVQEGGPGWFGSDEVLGSFCAAQRWWSS